MVRELFCDCVLTAGDARVYCHAGVVAAAAPVLEQALMRAFEAAQAGGEEAGWAWPLH